MLWLSVGSEELEIKLEISESQSFHVLLATRNGNHQCWLQPINGSKGSPSLLLHQAITTVVKGNITLNGEKFFRGGRISHCLIQSTYAVLPSSGLMPTSALILLSFLRYSSLALHEST